MEVSGQLHTPAALPPRKEPRYPSDTRLGGPQSRFGLCEERNLAPAGNQTPAVQPVGILTELSRLQDPKLTDFFLSIRISKMRVRPSVRPSAELDRWD
jgi:hypothetical protein